MYERFKDEVSESDSKSGKGRVMMMMAPPVREYAAALGRIVVLTLLSLVCAACIASVCRGEDLRLNAKSIGPSGTGAGNFERAAAVAVDSGNGNVFVIDQEASTLYAFDEDGDPVNFSGTSSDVVANEITSLNMEWKPEPGGGPSGSVFGTVQVAVNAASHEFYVTADNGTTLRAFQASGEPAPFSTGPSAGTNELTGFNHLAGVAVDAEGNIYASEYGPYDGSGGTVRIFASSGAPITSVEVSKATNLAVAGDGSIYVVTGSLLTQTSSSTKVVKLRPSVSPPTPATEYAVEEEFANPPAPFGLGVDPSAEGLYVVGGEDIFDVNSRIVHYDPAGNLIGSFAGVGEDGELRFSLGVAVNATSGKIYASYFAHGSRVEIFEPPPPEAPQIVSLGATNVTSGSSDLVAAIDPHKLTTTYYFELGTQPCSAEPDPCTTVQPAPGEIPAGVAPVDVLRHQDQLLPSTTYHFRVIAENELGHAEVERTFTTQAAGGPFELIDGRGWELVSPPLKSSGGQIWLPSGISGASADGGAFTFPSLGPLSPAVEGNRAPETSQSLARHGAGGWASSDIEPPREFAAAVFPGASDFRLVSADLARAAVQPYGVPPLSPEATEPTPYLRENFTEPAGWRPLVNGSNVPAGTKFGGEPMVTQETPVEVVGGSSDLGHVVLRARVPLVEGFNGELTGKELLYEWSNGALQLVSILASGQPKEGRLGSAESVMGTTLGAVSEDGRYVYWNAAASALYVRDVVNGESVRLDTVRSGASGKGNPAPVFQGASADGTRVFFTDTQQLTSDAGSGANLYECDLVHTSIDKCLLRNLTPETGSEGADVQGMPLGINAAGTTIYFMANGVLAEAPNAAGESAEPGNCIFHVSSAPPNAGCNLYVSRIEGESWQTRFVTRLSIQDRTDWGGGNVKPSSLEMTAAVSPSGRYLTFMSRSSLTGADNTDASGGSPDQEVFVYDLTSGSLRCASCNPTGGRPNGQLFGNGFGVRVPDPRHIWNSKWVAATLPEASVVTSTTPAAHRPRAVLDNGRVFFNSSDSLVPGDVNGTWDAYEYEPSESGSCAGVGAGSAVADTAGGCVGLLSSGSSNRESAILDSSLSGEDVFLLTTSQLSPLDVDFSYDVYDAHVCGAGWECPVPPPPPPPPCASADTCRQSGGGGEEPLSPGSEAFQGAGNLSQKHHHRHHRKHRKHHREHKKKHHAHRTAGKNNRNAGNGGGRS